MYNSLIIIYNLEDSLEEEVGPLSVTKVLPGTQRSIEQRYLLPSQTNTKHSGVLLAFLAQHSSLFTAMPQSSSEHSLLPKINASISVDGSFCLYPK